MKKGSQVDKGVKAQPVISVVGQVGHKNTDLKNRKKKAKWVRPFVEAKANCSAVEEKAKISQAAVVLCAVICHIFCIIGFIFILEKHAIAKGGETSTRGCVCVCVCRGFMGRAGSRDTVFMCCWQVRSVILTGPTCLCLALFNGSTMLPIKSMRSQVVKPAKSHTSDTTNGWRRAPHGHDRRSRSVCSWWGRDGPTPASVHAPVLLKAHQRDKRVCACVCENVHFSMTKERFSSSLKTAAEIKWHLSGRNVRSSRFTWKAWAN